VGIEEDGAPTGPYKFSLRQNYPNPFNGKTIISFHLVSASTISLHIYSITGHLIMPLINKETLQAGEYNFTWEGRNAQGINVSTGIYFYELYVNGIKESKAMIMIK
jgi:flagellar hook assembly protein FlgD